GTAFQIADDILDYTGDSKKMGKHVGDDLLEGKVTLPLLYLIKNGTPEQQHLIITAINQPACANVALIVATLNHSQAITYCSEMAHRYIDKAIAELAVFPDSVYKEAMVQLAKLAVSRIS
ncbi:MAG: polyprenyl synthetase family protein, partial [Burkholderiales bacterium]